MMQCLVNFTVDRKKLRKKYDVETYEQFVIRCIVTRGSRPEDVGRGEAILRMPAAQRLTPHYLSAADGPRLCRRCIRQLLGNASAAAAEP
jgi:hypothetical protein